MVLRGYTWFRVQGSLLVVFRGFLVCKAHGRQPFEPMPCASYAIVTFIPLFLCICLHEAKHLNSCPL